MGIFSEIFSLSSRADAWNENWNPIRKCLNSKCFHFIWFFFLCSSTSFLRAYNRFGAAKNNEVSTEFHGILSFCLYPMRAFPVRMKFQLKYLMSLLIWLFEYHLQYNHFCACTDIHLSHRRTPYTVHITH